MIVTVDFVGICTHVRQSRWPGGPGAWPLAVPHRVLLPMMPEGYKNFIPEHIPLISGIPDADYGGLLQARGDGTYLIGGAALSIMVRGTSGLDYEDSWTRIPQMSADDRPSVVANVDVLSGNRDLHGLFDVDTGTFSAWCTGPNKGAAVARLTINPALAWLSVRPIPIGIPSPLVALPDGSAITVSHRSKDPSTNDFSHFGLHFVLATSIPATPPENRTPCSGSARSVIPIVDLGPGCSNTDYP